MLFYDAVARCTLSAAFGVRRLKSSTSTAACCSSSPRRGVGLLASLDGDLAPKPQARDVPDGPVPREGPPAV